MLIHFVQTLFILSLKKFNEKKKKAKEAFSVSQEIKTLVLIYYLSNVRKTFKLNSLSFRYNN